MNKRIKKKWIDALTSGTYKQGQGSLVIEVDSHDLTDLDEHKFCCLGVLTNLYVEENGNPYVWDSQYILDDKVLEWAELPLNNHAVACIYDGTQRTFVDLNDDSNLNFKQIAQVIKEQL